MNNVDGLEYFVKPLEIEESFKAFLDFVRGQELGKLSQSKVMYAQTRTFIKSYRLPAPNDKVAYKRTIIYAASTATYIRTLTRILHGHALPLVESRMQSTYGLAIPEVSQLCTEIIMRICTAKFLGSNTLCCYHQLRRRVLTKS